MFDYMEENVFLDTDMLIPTKEEIKELFNKYGVKDLKNKNGQSECYFCKNIRHRYSLTWTSFLYEYKEQYYCYDCLLSILLQQENSQLKQRIDKTIEYINNNSCGDLKVTFGKELLEILKGDNK